MNKNIESLLLYINENIRFGSTIPSKVMTGLLKEYEIDIDDRLVIYNELKELHINFYTDTKNPIYLEFNRLIICLSMDKKVSDNCLKEFFNMYKVDDSLQKDIRLYFEKKGYTMIKNSKDKTELYSDLFDEDDEEDLDSLLDSVSFNDEMSSFVEVADKMYNLDYLKDLSSGDEKQEIEALENLVVANKNLVWKILKKYIRLSTESVDQDDMYQAGMLGLLKAAEKFDLSQGFQFSTYATYWIRQSILREIANNSTVIRIPVHYREKIQNFLRTEKDLWNELGRPATIEELANELEVPEENIKDLQFYIKQSRLDSLDRPVGEEPGTYLGEFLEDKDNLSAEREVYLKTNREILEENMRSVLTEQEYNILMYRFGFYNDEVYTLEEIGDQYHLTRERIRQIQEKALRKLRKKKVIKNLEGLLDEYRD